MPILFLVAGLIFGSFLNVCIYRIPRDQSIIRPRSKCPACHAPIAGRDNIPLVSWIVLQGCCRACGRRISLRYPVVELLTAVLFIASYAMFGLSWLTLKACVLCFLLVGLIFMDAETGLLPSEFTYPGIALGTLFTALAPFDTSGTAFLARATGEPAMRPGLWLSLLDALAGVIVGAGFYFLAWAAYYLVRKRDGLGLGDIAMMAMVATFLGLKLTVLVLVLAPVLGTICVLLMLAAASSWSWGRSSPVASTVAPTEALLSRQVPFGVFIGVSAMVVLFGGERIWRWYLGLFV